jgi:hypothetical protein
MKIYFLKTNSYDLRKDKADRYVYLCNVGLQKIDPLPLNPNTLVIPTKYVVYSMLKRVSESLKHNQKQIYIPNCLLNEMIFDINSMCSEEEFNKLGSCLIRKRFCELFIKDALPQKRLALFNQIKQFLNEVSKIKCEEITVISHSFKLKLFEAYLKTNGQIELQPELITNFIKYNEKTFEFNEGFEYVI